MDSQHKMLSQIHGVDSPQVALSSTLLDLQGSVSRRPHLPLFFLSNLPQLEPQHPGVQLLTLYKRRARLFTGCCQRCRPQMLLALLLRSAFGMRELAAGLCTGVC